MMRKLFNKRLLLLMCMVMSIGMIFMSCERDNDGNSGAVKLLTFGPTPVARGAELRFIGQNMDKVTSIVLPGDIVIEAASFTSKSSELVTITVPQNAVPGLITIKTADGDIVTKTLLGFSEPISIDNFSPSAIKADSVFTINGDYLNLVKQVIFKDGVTVYDTFFISQNRKQIQLKLPATAQTGLFAVSNGKADPIIVYSTTELTVKLPAITTFSPATIKAGTALTITGTNLDLVKRVIFGGDVLVLDTAKSFTKTLTQIVLTVPATAKDGKITVVPASGVKVTSTSDLTMAVPTVNITPTTVKNGADITVTGTDLDLVDKVIFGGDKEGTIKTGRTATNMLVTIPKDATTGIVKFVTKASKTVNGPALTMIKPTITGISPLTTAANEIISITGTDLDLTKKVLFTGGFSTTVSGATATQMNVKVAPGSLNGIVALITFNGDTIKSVQSLNIVPGLPVLATVPSEVFLGSKITITGTKLDLFTDVVFPGDVKATMFGTKSSTLMEIYVPMNTAKGVGKIKFMNNDNEISYSSDIKFKLAGTEPVQDPKLLIYSFNTGWSGFTWDGVGGLGTQPDGIDGTNQYYEATPWNASKYWLFANNYISYPSVSQADYVVKMDVRLRKDVTGNAEIRLMLAGKTVNILSYVKVDDKFTTGGNWITITIPLSAFSGLADPTPDKGGEWGMTMWANGLDFSGLCVDNIRYEKKP